MKVISNNLANQNIDFQKREEINKAVNNTFMQVMFAQLKNQSPIDPVKSKEFVSHMGMMSQIAQSISSNSKLDRLVHIMSKIMNANTAQNADLLGKKAYIQHHISNAGDINFIANIESSNAQVAVEIINKSGSIINKKIYQASDLANQVTSISSPSSGTINAYFVDSMRPIETYIAGKITGISNKSAEHIYVDGSLYNKNDALLIGE